jgi:hypothetical protein
MITSVRRDYVPALAVIVGASFVIRTALAWLRSAPALFPDEYIYSAIGRSIADSGRPSIRGGSAHFPALLQPIATAPAWLLGDVDVGFRAVQAMGGLAMSLAAVPVFLLARRLGLSKWLGLAVAALTVLVPDLVYAAFVTSEPFAYPLFLATAAAATLALAGPTRRNQLAFVGFAALAALTRAQFAILPVVFLVAVVVQGSVERRLKAAAREQLLPFTLFALPAAALVLSGPARTLGYYHSVLHLHLHPISFLRWAGWDGMVLAYAGGWIIIPGALLGLWLILRRPSSDIERSFGVLVVLLCVTLLAEAGLLQANAADNANLFGPNEIKERYVFYLVPLLGLCFAVYAKRGWPLRVPHLVLAAALLVLSVRVPLSGFAIAPTLDSSPILYGVYWLTGELGQTSSSSLVVAAVAGVLSLAAVAGSRRPRLGTPLVLSLAILATAATSAAAIAFDVSSTAANRRAYMPSDPSFVDHSGLGHVALLQSWGGHQAPSQQQLFWNRSIDRLLLMPDAGPIDAFRDERVRIGKDGSLLAGGKWFRGPLLADNYGSFVRLRGAALVARGPVSTLWRPDGTPRLALYAPGSYYDGWLSDSGAIFLWPERAGGPVWGWLSMRVTAVRSLGPITLTFARSNGTRVDAHARPGSPERIRIAVCSVGRARVTYHSNVQGLVGLRVVTARATKPVFRSDPSACTKGADSAAAHTPGV